MGALSQEQIDKFWADGVLVAEDAVSAKELSELKQVFEGWVEDSCSYSEDYGETLDGRPRFDLQPGHRSDKPALSVCNHQKRFRIFLRTLCESTNCGLLRRFARPQSQIPSWQSEFQVTWVRYSSEMASRLSISADDK